MLVDKDGDLRPMLVDTNVPWQARVSLPVDVPEHLDRDGRGCDAKEHC